MPMQHTVYMLSAVHPLFDDLRIVAKEGAALVDAGFEVYYVGRGDPAERVINGVNVRGIRPRPGLISRLLAWLDLAKLAVQKKPDVVHFHDPELLPVMLAIRPFIPSKMIFDCHEFYDDTIPHKPYLPGFTRVVFTWLISRIFRLASPRLDAFVVVSDEMRSYFPHARKVVRVANYVQAERFAGVKPDYSARHLVIFAGRAFPAQGPSLPLDAFRQVVRVYPDAELHVIGLVPDSTMDHLRQLYADIWEQLVFHGQVSHLQLESRFSGKAISIIPFMADGSTRRVEMPVRLLEFAASGLCIVVSGGEGLRDAVNELGCGVFTGPGKTEELAQVVIELFQSPGRIQEFGVQGRQNVQQLFNWEREKIRLIQLYEELLRSS